MICDAACRKRLRWWPLGMLVTVVALAILVIRSRDGLSGQDRVIYTAAVIGSGVVLLWLWMLLLSPLSRKKRLWTAALALLALLGVGVLYRIEGVTGDLVPVLVPRWSLEGSGEPRHAGEEGSTPSQVIDLTTSSERDYPQFLGPARDAVVRGIRLERDWNQRPPRLLWRRAVGAGWSSFAVVNGYAVTQEQHGEEERVVCYAVESGKEIWTRADRARFYEILGGEGPRATPTIAGGRVYSLGATGILNCLDGATGRLRWQKNILEDNQAGMNTWGTSGSPLVVGELVVVSAGGRDGRSLVAYHTMTGEGVWSGGDDRSGYSSPFVTELAGRRQIVIFNDSSVAAHDLSGGELLWTYPWPEEFQNICQPLRAGKDRLLISSGYGVGCALLQVQAGDDGRLSARPLWKNRNLKSKFANAVARDGFAYGFDDGIFVCLDLTSGERRWKGGRYGHGQVLLAGDLLLIQAENGAVVLVEPTPKAHRELARLEAIAGKTWNHPALAGSHLLVRNHHEAACYELPLLGL